MVGLLVLVLVSALAVLWPWRFTFRLSATVLLEDHAGASSRTKPDELRAFLARTIDGHHDANQTTLRRLLRTFQVGSVLLVAETVALLFAI